jgi:hypothetical protein
LPTKNFAALSLFTLPFGLRALALLQKEYPFGGGARRGADLHFNARNWNSGVTGARQLRGGWRRVGAQGESDMFMGSTVQVDNILDTSGTPTGTTTLGQSVSEIFNNEFLLGPSLQFMRQRGVPLTRMDLSGYGASIFSDWRNPKAGMAETSQAKFDVFVGRCAHEIIQVRTILYPFAAKFVRTISLFRANSGYFYRFDSGWVAESDGRFNFTYFVYVPGTDDDGNPVLVPVPRDAGYPIHPGIVHGLFQIKNIRETTEVERFTGTMEIPPGGFYVDINGQEVQNTTGAGFPIVYNLQPVFFDADIEIENPVSGFVTKQVSGAQRKLVPSKRILGFVQLAPRGMPLTVDAFKDLLARQGGNIGGPIDCVIDIGGSGQQMRLNRFDVSTSFAADGAHPAFAVPGRGSVLLPKDGSWSVVKHEAGTGQVSPVPPDLSVPLIRVGQVIPGTSDYPTTELLRIANPTELLRAPAPDTINYGFLQSTDTQKALFLTPSFKQGVATLLSKTPPLFADAYRIVKSKGIFRPSGCFDQFRRCHFALKKGRSSRLDAKRRRQKCVELMQINDGVVLLKKAKLLKSRGAVSICHRSGFNQPERRACIYLEYKAQKWAGKLHRG